ncbi:MAG TPA: lipoate--protein ligase family protein [Urbifossiella sp.]|nr:lipoate--protein ligase family protein [Urbifossiella sp.]
MTPPIRLLPLARSDGATHMAADEAMLETASERGVASLRFYTWSKPTLSLGYFQASGGRQPPDSLIVEENQGANAPRSPLPVVRRATGGAAILHHRELTYALALPEGKAWHSRESWICRFHHLLRDVLAESGIAAHLVVCGEERKLGDVLCFLHQTPGDLLVNGSKVAGSAQRKLKGALLQHGSILLSRSEFAPMLPGINDMSGCEPFTPERLADALASRFAAQPNDWTAEETERIAAIRAAKYANPAWNEKR